MFEPFESLLSTSDGFSQTTSQLSSGKFPKHFPKTSLLSSNFTSHCHIPGSSDWSPAKQVQKKEKLSVNKGLSINQQFYTILTVVRTNS